MNDRGLSATPSSSRRGTDAQRRHVDASSSGHLRTRLWTRRRSRGLRLVFHAVDEQVNVRGRHRHIPDDIHDVLGGRVAGPGNLRARSGLHVLLGLEEAQVVVDEVEVRSLVQDPTRRRQVAGFDTRLGLHGPSPRLGPARQRQRRINAEDPAATFHIRAPVKPAQAVPPRQVFNCLRNTSTLGTTDGMRWPPAGGVEASEHWDVPQLVQLGARRRRRS